MASPDVHIIIVPGSWHTPAHASPLIESLRSQGVAASTLLLPTCDLSHTSVLDLDHPDLAGPPPAKPWPDMSVDAHAIRAEITRFVNAGKKVLVVAHSYGGVPSSEAILPELCRKTRQGKGEVGGVIGFFALSSFFLPPGMNTVDAMGGKPLPATPVQPSGLHVIVDPKHHLFNDFEPHEQDHWISLLRPQSWLVHTSRAQNPGHTNVPCAFMKTTKDNITPIAGQEFIIKAARASGLSVEEYSVDAGHESLISQPDRCAEAIVDFTGKCLK